MNEQCLFIGGPDCISGTVQEVPIQAERFNLHVMPPFMEHRDRDFNSESRIQLHEYRRHNIRYGTKSNMNYYVVFFHSSIGNGDEVAALIQAATKRL